MAGTNESYLARKLTRIHGVRTSIKFDKPLCVIKLFLSFYPSLDFMNGRHQYVLFSDGF